MIGLVYKDTVLGVFTDKICTNVSGNYSADLPANLHTAAATLTSPQIKYMRIIANDTISFTEL